MKVWELREALKNAPDDAVVEIDGTSRDEYAIDVVCVESMVRRKGYPALVITAVQLPEESCDRSSELIDRIDELESEVSSLRCDVRDYARRRTS